MRNSSRLKLTHFFIAFSFMLLAGSLQQAWADANTSDTAAFQCGALTRDIVDGLGGTLTAAEAKVKEYIHTFKTGGLPDIPQGVCENVLKAMSKNNCCSKGMLNTFSSISSMFNDTGIITKLKSACGVTTSKKPNLGLFLALGVMCKNKQGQTGQWCASIKEPEEFRACACGSAIVSVMPLIRSGDAGPKLKNAINSMDLQGTGMCKMISNANSKYCCTPSIKKAILAKYPGAESQLTQFCKLLGNSFELGFLEAFAC